MAIPWHATSIRTGWLSQGSPDWALHPDVLLREVDEKGLYTLYFHRRIDGITLLCEYCFTSAPYGDERVILQLYRRMK